MATVEWARAASIDDVLERMAAIDADLPKDDGVARFNELYLAVTRAVLRETRDGEFEDPAFLTRLDVVFADLYFAAVEAPRPGHAWRPLFDARRRARVASLQFALAGMNAHISHDLPLAVVDACVELGKAPEDESPEHHDFTRTNDVLAVAQEEIKSWFSTGVIATVDQLGGRVDDGFAAFGIHLARAGAWQTSEVLWELSANERLDRIFRQGLARSVEMASRGILL